MVERRAVVVVGAGPCGLAAVKELREAGHDVVALEKSGGIGGVFSRTHDTQYENLYLTISNMFMAFSDFPPQPLRVKYSSKEEYGRYLEAYADAFGLREHVRLSTEVVAARLVTGRWQITTRRVGDESGATQQLDAGMLIVATGSNHVPRRIALPGFTGEVTHSSEFRSPTQLAGKRVLVVGSGESAFDLSADLCGHAEAVTVWARSPIAPANGSRISPYGPGSRRREGAARAGAPLPRAVDFAGAGGGLAPSKRTRRSRLAPPSVCCTYSASRATETPRTTRADSGTSTSAAPGVNGRGSASGQRSTRWRGASSLATT